MSNRLTQMLIRPFRLGRNEVLNGGSYRALRHGVRVSRWHPKVWVLVTVNVVLLLAVAVLGYLLAEGPRGVEPVEIIKVAAGPAVPPGTD